MSNYNSKLQLNNTTLQTILSKINDLPEESGGVELPELTNEGSAADLLAGKELIDGDGNKVTGTIPTKTATDVSASGATVTIPAGYYAAQATKSVATATRADTTISVTADDTNDKLTITGSNNQTTGYVTGANKTASTTVTLTASGNTVTATETGGKKVSKAVASGSAKTPATTITKTPSISVNSSGLITASVSGTQNVTPTVTAGYVSAGTAGTITVSGSATKQLTTQAAKTITPSTSSQTAVASGRYTTGDITVEAIPSKYKDTSDATASESTTFLGETFYANGEKKTGTFTISEEMSTQNNLISQIQTALANKAQVSPVLQAKSVIPSAVQQVVTADSEYYDGLLSVTVTGDENLVPENIVSGVSIFGIEGSASGGGSVGAVDTCTVTISTNHQHPIIYSTVDESGSITTAYTSSSLSSTTHTVDVVCGSYLFIPLTSTIPAYTISGGAEYIETLVGYSAYRTVVFKITATIGENITIRCYDDD